MRNYHIINIPESSESPPGYQKVLINNIDQIINHSADNVLLNCLEYQDKSSLRQNVMNAMTKLKPNGQIHIGFTDFKKIFEHFLSSKISSSQVLSFLKNKNDIIIIEEILSIIDINTFKLINTNYNNFNINMIIERTAI